MKEFAAEQAVTAGPGRKDVAFQVLQCEGADGQCGDGRRLNFELGTVGDDDAV